MKLQAGITLIEVLIAMLVLAIGLLGIAGLQTSAMSINLFSYQSTQAAVLAESMVERMRANRGAYENSSRTSSYSLAAGKTPTSVSTDCSKAVCSSSQQALWDMAVWYSQVVGGKALTNVTTPGPQDTNNSNKGIPALPSGAVSITCDNPFQQDKPGNCVVTVYWDPGHSADSTSADYYGCDPGKPAALRCYRVSVMLP